MWLANNWLSGLFPKADQRIGCCHVVHAAHSLKQPTSVHTASSGRAPTLSPPQSFLNSIWLMSHTVLPPHPVQHDHQGQHSKSVESRQGIGSEACVWPEICDQSKVNSSCGIVAAVQQYNVRDTVLCTVNGCNPSLSNIPLANWLGSLNVEWLHSPLKYGR